MTIDLYLLQPWKARFAPGLHHKSIGKYNNPTLYSTAHCVRRIWLGGQRWCFSNVPDEGPGTSLQYRWTISGTMRIDWPNRKHRCLIFEAMGPEMASVMDTTIEDL